MLVVFNNTICPGNLIWVRSRNESKPGIGHSQVRPVSGFSEPASPAAGHESPGLQVVLGPCSAGPRAARGNPPAPQPGASLVRRVPSGSTRSNRSAGRETKPTNSRGRVSKSMSAPPPGAIVRRSVTRGGSSAGIMERDGLELPARAGCRRSEWLPSERHILSFSSANRRYPAPIR